MRGSDSDVDGIATRVLLHAVPGARHNAIEWTAEGQLRIRVVAPARDGRANRALVDLLARALGLRRNDIRLVHGACGRRKLVQISGMSPEDIRQKLHVED